MRSAFRFDMTAVEDRLGSADREESGDDAERDKSPEQSNVAIYVSIGANVAIAVTKLIAAGVSGSSADDVAAAIPRFEDRLQRLGPM